MAARSSAPPCWLSEAQRLRAAGSTLRAIAGELGVSYQRVGYWLDPERGRYLSLDRKRRHGLVSTSRFTDGQTSSAHGLTLSNVQAQTVPDRYLGFRLDAELEAKIRAAAQRDDRTVSAEIRHLLRRALQPSLHREAA